MGRGLTGRILEGIRKRQEDSELQMYATEPPGAMGEQGEQVGGTFRYKVEPKATVPFKGPGSEKEPWFHPVSGSVQAASIEDAVTKVSLEMPRSQYPEHRAQKILDGGERTDDGGLVYDGPEYKVIITPGDAMGEDDPPDEEMEFTIDESAPFDENEWMTLDEMELECVECAGKMRDRKMTRIKRSEAQECVGRYGKKKPSDEG